MIRVVLMLLIILMNVERSFGQDSSDYILVNKNPFINAFVQRKGAIYPIINDSKPIGKASKDQLQRDDQVLFKTPTHTYIYILNTGRLYRLAALEDSAYRFNRIDVTYTSFYNIGAKVFTIGEDLYSFSGYGFWKTNGTLRKFNFKDKEWDVVPLSQEIIPQVHPVSPVWVNNETQKIYVPFQKLVNEGVKGPEGSPGKVIDDTYLLDIPTLKWVKIGKVTSQFYNLFKDLGASDNNYQDANGRLLFFLYSIYWLDYDHNMIRYLDDPTKAQSLTRFAGGARNIRYLYNNYMFVYDPYVNKYDSMKLDLSQFKTASFRIWQTDLTPWYWGGAFLLFVFALIYSIRSRSLRRQKQQHREVKHKNGLTLELSEPEMALIQLLIGKSAKGDHSTIDEINYVLGIKDKNVGIQKKVRSDVINGLNQKYALLSGEQEQLISSVRSEMDKRYFEYFISREIIPSIQSMIQHKKGIGQDETT